MKITKEPLVVYFLENTVLLRSYENCKSIKRPTIEY